MIWKVKRETELFLLDYNFQSKDKCGMELSASMMNQAENVRTPWKLQMAGIYHQKLLEI